ncbi:MAG: sulfite oxidase [Proteobacteria bacterium]|nr:sulfite oxidase [Pseudomonadota bacterium]
MARQPASAQRPQEVLPDRLNSDHFLVHKTNPLSLESKRSSLGRGPITDTGRLFVRNNLPLPSSSIVEKADDWVLELGGLIKGGSITLRELKTYPFETLAMVLQCSGNGRGFFEHNPSGSPWKTGAAGAVLWTGVRLSVLLSRYGGPQNEAKYITATGGEVLPQGIERDSVVVERSIPLRKGMKDCLLAWELNGQPIPLTHGGPLRFVVPGYFGCNQIKYVRKIAATKTQSSAKIQQTGYRFRPIGEKGASDQPSMWRMPVKSWFNGPGSDGSPLTEGMNTFYGVAFSGERGISKVEVSLDKGQSWVEAKLVGDDFGPSSWRTFLFKTQLKVGSYTLHSRATDKAGEVQPKDRTPNERGYGHNGWFDHGLNIRVSNNLAIAASDPKSTHRQPVKNKPASSELSASAQRGKEIFLNKAEPSCGVCHTLSDAGTVGAVGPNLDQLKPAQTEVMMAVRNGVGAMPDYGSKLSATELGDLATYVVEAAKR